MPAVTRLALTDFRSYAVAELAAAPGAVVITGDNGAGKTNILDAISLLGPGRGLRGAPLSDAARSGGPGGWSVAATLAAPGGDVEIGTGTAAAAPERRLVRVNGAAASAATLGDWLALVWLTPAMDRIFADTPAARRRFLDRLVLALHPGHARETVRYDAAMRGRTRLLTGEAVPDPHWLAALELQMADHGAAIAAARADTVAALVERLAGADDAVFARPLLALAGDATPDLAAALARNRGADATAGRALLGPHRADLLVTHAAKGEPAARGSTGEQKALLIAITLAHAGLVAARTGQAPVLLLDEIAAHLDARRRAALFDRLAATGSQVWMTGTDPALFDAVGTATRLAVVHGEVVATRNPAPAARVAVGDRKENEMTIDPRDKPAGIAGNPTPGLSGNPAAGNPDHVRSEDIPAAPEIEGEDDDTLPSDSNPDPDPDGDRPDHGGIEQP